MQKKGNTEQGFTLTELLVTMGIVLIVMTAAYQSYIRLLKGAEIESSSAESQMENMVNTNLLRMDILHSGFGLSSNSSTWPVNWNQSNKELYIHSTVNNLDKKTRQWALCSNNGTMNPDLDMGSDYKYVILDRDEMHYGNLASCPTELGVYFAYPYNTSDMGEPYDACGSQFCFEIIYSLSNTQTLEGCAQGTTNLQRTSDNRNLWRPIINCVADWQPVFELDNGNRVTDLSTFTDPEDLRDRLYMIHVYILAQESDYKEDFDFSGDISLQGVSESLSLGDVTDSSHYRWNKIHFAIKPKDL